MSLKMYFQPSGQRRLTSQVLEAGDTNILGS